MEERIIEIERRQEVGSAANGRIRRSGKIPAIVYQSGQESLPVVVGYEKFIRIAEVSTPSQIFTFKSDDSSLDGRKALVREIQNDYLKGKVLHIDFQSLRDDVAITIPVSIKVVGESPGVKNDGGVLTIVSHHVRVSCLPKDIPNSIPVDISSLTLNHSIHVKDITLPEGVEAVDDLDETLISVVAPRAATEGAGDAASEGATDGAAVGDAAKAPADAKKADGKK